MHATPAQLKALHAVLYKKNLLSQKAIMVQAVTNGRSSSSKDLTKDEAAALLADLTRYQSPVEDSNSMIRKLFAMAHTMGWCPKVQAVGEDGKIVTKKDYSRLHNWVQQYGYLHKHLNEYKYSELPKLLTAFTFVYKEYLNNLNK